MRVLTLAFAAGVIGTMSAAAPAAAQIYAPGYPVCLLVYGGLTGGYTECGYSSMAQCAASASGRGATCVINPNYGNGGFRVSPGAPAAPRAPWR